MNIVCFGQQNWHVTWTAKQQLLTRLARRGHRVLYVDPIPTVPDADAPLGHRLAALWPGRSGVGVQQVQDGLHVFTPTQPTVLPQRLRGRWLGLALRGVTEQLGLWAPVAICCWPAQRWLMSRIDACARVYLAFDDNASFKDLPEEFAEHQRREEALLLREADLVLTVSPTLAERFGATHERVLLQENGVDLDDFSTEAMAAAPPHPVFVTLPEGGKGTIGFVGNIDDRLDIPLLRTLADRLPEVNIVLFGRVAEPEVKAALEDFPNIHFAGFVPYRDLAGVYSRLDAGIVPYVDSPLTRACNPLKVYEYLAADLPTVTTPLPGLNSTRDAVTVATNADAFVEAIEQALRSPEAGAEARWAVAKSAGWQKRTDELEERLRLAMSIASERREAAGLPHPRPDRRGRQVVKLTPLLDGKDRSVRELHGNYDDAALSWQQHLIYLVIRGVGIGYWAVRRLAHPLSPAVRRILVVRNGHLGDTVVFFPTLAALRRRFPEARIEVAVAPGGGARRLLEASPYVDEVLELDFFHQPRWRRLRGAVGLLARGYDLALGGAWYFHLPEAVFSGAPRRLGLYDGHPLQRYADRVLMLDPNLHEAENNLRLAELVCGSVDAAERVPHLALDDDVVRRKAVTLRENLDIGAAPVVCIHAGSKRPSRRWPARSFATLAAALLYERPELHVVLTGAGAEERELNRGIVADILEMDAGVGARVHDATDLGDLLAVIGLYDSARLLICNDTGVMHVARARQTPLLAVIGPENDQRWGPYPLGLAPAVTVRAQVPGTPHGKWDCPWGLSLRAIEPELVLRHALELLDANSPAGPMRVAGRTHFPLHRDVTRLSFTQLAERGLRLPGVAVILPHDGALLGIDPSAIERSAPEAVAAAARGLRQQHYPSLDILLVSDEPEAFEGLDCGDAQLIGVGGDNPDAAWARIMAQTPAELFFPWTPDVTLSPSGIANRVAVHLRGPSTESADAQRHHPLGQSVGRDLFRGALLYTRAAMESLLRQPMNSGRTLSPAPIRADEVFIAVPAAGGHLNATDPVPA